VKLRKIEFGDSLDFPLFKGRINPDFKHPLLLEKLSACERLLQDLDGQVFTDRRNRVVLNRLSLSDDKSLDVVIKEFRPRSLNNLKTIFFPSRAHKAWDGGVLLMRKGIPTPVPVAYLERKKIFPTKKSYYLTVMEQESEEIRHLFRRLNGEELERLLRVLARQLFFCHEQGILHRDLSDGNVLVMVNSEGNYMFSLIDTNRIRVKKRIGIARRIKNLIRLGIPRLYQPFFLRQYTGTERLKKSVWYWYWINKNTYTHFTDLKKRLFSR
jgi:hypothetical protein